MSNTEQHLERLFAIIGSVQGGFAIRLTKRKISKAYLIEIRNQLSQAIKYIDELLMRL